MPWITKGRGADERVDKRGAEQDRDGRRAENQALRSDGTLRRPTTIWVVRYGDDLYIRPVNGRTSGWFRGTQVRLEGHIQCGGVGKDGCTFVSVDAADDVNAEIDAAYRAKYHRYPASFVDAVLTPEAKSATIKLQSRS